MTRLGTKLFCSYTRQSILGLTVLLFSSSTPAAENFSRYENESRSLLEVPTFVGDSAKAGDTLIQAGSLGFERIRGKGPERVEKRAKDQVYLTEPPNEVVVAAPKKVIRKPASDKNRQAKVKKGRNYVLKMQPKFWRLIDLSSVAQARVSDQNLPAAVNGNQEISLNEQQQLSLNTIDGLLRQRGVNPSQQERQALINAISKANNNQLTAIQQGDITTIRNLLVGVDEAVAAANEKNGSSSGQSNPGGGSPGGGAGVPGGSSNQGQPGQNAQAAAGIAAATMMMAGSAMMANDAVQGNQAQANGQVTQTAIKAGEAMHNASAAAGASMFATQAQVDINKMNQDGATQREGMKLMSQDKAGMLNAAIETSKLMAKKSSDAAAIRAAQLQSWVTTTLATMQYNTTLAIASLAGGGGSSVPGGGMTSPYNGGRGPSLSVKPKNAQIPGSYALMRQPTGVPLNSQWQSLPPARTPVGTVGVKRSVSNRLLVSSKQVSPSTARGLTRTRTPSLADGSTAQMKIRIPDTYAPIRTLAAIPAVAGEPHVNGTASPGEYTRKIGPVESHSQEDEE